MKCLSVKQPWANYIIYGDKRIENRPKRTHYRGPVLIHSSKKPLFKNSEYPVGCILGQVDIVDCVSIEEVCGQPYAYGPWCWTLDNVLAFPEPIPFKGALSFFQVPDELVREQLELARQATQLHV